MNSILLRYSYKMIPLLALSLFADLRSSEAKESANSLLQKASENQIRNLIEPLLDRYCHESCKLLGTTVTVENTSTEEFVPGFDDMGPQETLAPSPTSGKIKLLIDEKLGPVSRGKLTDLLQQYLDTLNFPIKIETQIAHFPTPQGSDGKLLELRERVSKQFLSTMDELLKQLCPKSCILADFNLNSEAINGEEAQYTSPGEIIQDGNTALRIKEISATLLMDESLSPEEQANILDIAKLKTNGFKHVNLTGKSMKFPKAPDLGTDRNPSSTTGPNGEKSTGPNGEKRSEKTATSDTNTANSSNNSNNSSKNSSTDSKQEKFEKFEKIERVENGDAVQAELEKFKLYGGILSAALLAILILILALLFRSPSSQATSLPAYQKPLGLGHDGFGTALASKETPEERSRIATKKYEIERILEELGSIYANLPKVTKQVFSRVLTEEGVELTSKYIHLFGEGIMTDMLRDPSLQSDLAELLEFYSKTSFDLADDEKLDLLKKLHNRTVAGKLTVLGNRSSTAFDFLDEMDGTQILDLIRTESITLKAIVLTQCDTQKRASVYSQLDSDVRIKLLTELSRIDYLPRDYIYNVATALKRKKKETPKLNTEALPGSEVLVSLLERTGQDLQRSVIHNLENSNPDSARTVKGKLVSIETLRYLRDGQLLEVILSLKHDELIQFLKGTAKEIREVIFSKSPRELVLELEDEINQVSVLSREAYNNIERKILNKMKVMTNEGQINLIETNERMFSELVQEQPILQTTKPPAKWKGGR